MTESSNKPLGGGGEDPGEHAPRSGKPGGLDAQLDQSMEASDPPSVTQPGNGEAEAEAHPS